MRVIILGSGVIGVTSAWYLARAGHEVMVLDRQPGPALETSAGNAGQISPGYAAPWAAPGVPLKAIKWMFQRHAPLAIRLNGADHQFRWLWQMLRNCDSRHYYINKSRMVRLAEYSRDCLKALRADESLQIDELLEKLETQLTSSEVFTALFELEMSGRIRCLPGKNYVRTL